MYRLIGLAVAVVCLSGCPSEAAATDDGDAESATDSSSEDDGDTECEFADESWDESWDSVQTVNLRVENVSARPVFIGGGLGFGCPGYRIDPVGAEPGAVPARGGGNCADVARVGACGHAGHGWCPGTQLERIDPGEAYETLWNGRLFTEVEVPACFACDETATCAAEFAAVAGSYRVQFDTYESETDGPIGVVEVMFEHPTQTDVVLEVD